MRPILFVDDDKEYAKFFVDLLEKEGFEVLSANDSTSAITLISKEDISLLITDLYIDTIDGVQLSDIAKNVHPGIKTIVLTGNPTVQNEYRAISENIDLFLVKGKPAKIVMEYVRNLSQDSNTLVLKNRVERLVSIEEKLEMDLVSGTVMRNDKNVELTPTEYSILKILLQNKNVLITRRDFIDKLWGEGDNERVIDVHIKNLRTKLRLFSIATVQGQGYRWSE
ncbi:response regulator transcription factor [Erysipelothrix sp. HDW6C]|uniref:response regulator transcription factor n=1 Tax=Erysipelothrix sp. HDW6C TaxID=2714930 RepID=UPI00140829BE|nr:response regulator transcription factor [Erysipelothrix sp. HDW6C]QIK70400.1 response regulator transcription factor [Erysipelothrix sp. HDW6C]